MEVGGVCGGLIVGVFLRRVSRGGRGARAWGQVGENGSKTTRISPAYGQVHLRLIRGPERIETRSRVPPWDCRHLRLIRGPERIETTLADCSRGYAPISGSFVGRSELKLRQMQRKGGSRLDLRLIRGPERIETASVPN